MIESILNSAVCWYLLGLFSGFFLATAVVTGIMRLKA